MRLIPRSRDDDSAAVTLMGLRFPNRIGLAAGFDKNARYIDALGSLGFGFIEVGTVDAGSTLKSGADLVQVYSGLIYRGPRARQ